MNSRNITKALLVIIVLLVGYVVGFTSSSFSSASNVMEYKIIAFDHRLAEFQARGINVIGVSIDSQFSHFAWKNTPVNEGGIGQIKYPLVADLTKEISKAYDVLLDGGVALRGSFLIDKDGTIRHAVINDLPLGRNIDEMLRMVDAMQFTNEHGEVCAAGWNKGDEGMKATTEGVAEYLAKHESDL